MPYPIVPLPKEDWAGAVVPIRYTTNEYYDVTVRETQGGFQAEFCRKPFETPVTHTPEEYDFPDKLYSDYRPGAFAWGVVQDGELAAAIETEPEEWSNRLRVTELWVAPKLRRQGLGHRLMAVAKEQARLTRRRALMLETQSCNTAAIDFYRAEGFSLIGFDACCYSNNDPARREVRMELGILYHKPQPLTPGALTLRPMQPEDRRAVEEMTRRAFWNKNSAGCNEHLLVRRLWEAPVYLPQLSRAAFTQAGEPVGCIFYSEAALHKDGKTTVIPTFGPLCVDPAWQGRGVGALLLRETLALAAAAGWPGVVIFGEPDYYPRLGFQTCEHFGITTMEGGNSDSFLGYELRPGALSAIGGAFMEAPVFEHLDLQETRAFDRAFPPLEAQYYPHHWAPPAL